MMLRAASIAILWLAVLPTAAAELQPASIALSSIAGEWRGTGTTSGMPSDQRLHWEMVLDGKFLRLTLDNRMTLPDGMEWLFQAQAFYRPTGDGTVAGTWFDSRGRSTYRIVDGKLEVTDEVQEKDGTLRVFGRSTLERSP